MGIISKVLATVLGDFQSVAIPFLISRRKYFERRYFERETTERNVIIWRIPVRVPEIVTGRNPTNNNKFVQYCTRILQNFRFPVKVFKSKLTL